MERSKNGNRPFFSIGVTTYDRHELLRETLKSILAQTFADFEVIVGNDYTAETLTAEMLGISDPRIRIVNHPRNLREIGNMNALLGMATGRYFTWLFDDDLYDPDFLQTGHDSLAETGYPPAFFSTFRFLRPNRTFQPGPASPRGRIATFTGREFLRWYSPRRMQIASILGLFDLEVLRSTLGGVEELCPFPIGVYAEYLFLVRCGLLDRIIYVDKPLYIYRVHPESWSDNAFEIDKYLAAGRELVRKSAEVLRHPSLAADFDANLMMICEQHLVTVAHRSAVIEGLRRRFGVVSFRRAMARYRSEAAETQINFLTQGGSRGLRTKLGFMKIDMYCYRLMLVTTMNHFVKAVLGIKR